MPDFRAWSARRGWWHGRRAREGEDFAELVGKSGGYRVITFYAGPKVPTFRLARYAKGKRADLSKAERNELRRELAGLAEDYRKGVTRHVRSR